MTKKKEISLIIPTYMEESSIGILLENIYPFRQSHNVEVIVSDGGSTDATCDIAIGLCDKLVKNYIGERQTIGEGRNIGADNAESDTLIFLNADTTPADLDFFFNFILNWSKGNGKFADAKALSCRVGPYPNDVIWKDKLMYPFLNTYFGIMLSLGMGTARGECQIIKKSAFTEVGGYDNTLAAGEDVELFRRLSAVCRVQYASQILVYESPRRFRKDGYLKTLSTWLLNDIWVRMRGKSYSKEWAPVR